MDKTERDQRAKIIGETCLFEYAGKAFSQIDKGKNRSEFFSINRFCPCMK
jgi:hypothetical protein